MTVKHSSEPFYVRQTFDAADFDQADQWRRRCADAAREEAGCPIFCRFSWDHDRKGLLFEAWYELPSDQDFPRWSISDV